MGSMDGYVFTTHVPSMVMLHYGRINMFNDRVSGEIYMSPMFLMKKSLQVYMYISHVNGHVQPISAM